MEYQKKMQLERHYLNSESPQYYKAELSSEDKDSILSDIYKSIQMFYELVHEAKKKSFNDQ